MNDIEKLSPDTKKLLAVRAKQESESQVRQLANARRAARQGIPVEQLRQHDALVPQNTLLDNNDGQTNLLPRDQLPTGIVVNLVPWEDMEFESGYNILFAIDDEDMETNGRLVTVLPDFQPFDHAIDLDDYLLDHGPHVLRWMTQGHDTGNPIVGPDLPFFIDIHHPNLMQQPDPILLPADLPDGDITQDYLDTNGGVVFTLPPLSDSRDGDLFTFYINTVAFLTDQPAAPPYEFTVTTADFERVAEGLLTLTYTVVDRAGNRTDESLPRLVQLIKSPIPVLRAPLIPEGPDITLDDARDGVTVLQDYDTPMEGDFVVVYWQDYDMDLFYHPTTSVEVPLDIVKIPGDIYPATVYYLLNRKGKVYRSPDLVVDVDVERVGPINPEEPEIVNPDLDPLELVSFTNLTNQIVPADKDQPATITVPIYAPVNVGEVIEVFYGNLGNSVEAVTLDQPMIDAGEITVILPWAIIDAVGNGTIEAFYRIYPANKPNNGQQSPSTPIVVTVHNIADLPVPGFPDRIVSLNIINCTHVPWENGVNVRIEYPDFEENDKIRLNWVLDNTVLLPGDTTLPTDPLEASRTDFPYTVSAPEAAAGRVTMNVWWGPHVSALTEGCIVVEWHLTRGDVNGSSPPHFVRYSRHRPAPGRPVCPDDDPPEET